MTSDQFKALIEKNQEQHRIAHRNLQNEFHCQKQLFELKIEHSIAIQDLHARYAEQFAEVLAGLASQNETREETPVPDLSPGPKAIEVHNATMRLIKQIEKLTYKPEDNSPEDTRAYWRGFLEAFQELRAQKSLPPWPYDKTLASWIRIVE